MRRIYYNSWLAKAILWSGYSTAMFFGKIGTKHDASEPLSERVKRHESIHCEQYWEVTAAMFIVAVILQLIFGGGWWLVAVPFMYYVFYFLEAAITWTYRLFKNGWKEAAEKAYKYSMFEQEAKDGESIPGYVESRKIGAFLRYFGRI